MHCIRGIPMGVSNANLWSCATIKKNGSITSLPQNLLSSATKPFDKDQKQFDRISKLKQYFLNYYYF